MKKFKKAIRRSSSMRDPHRCQQYAMAPPSPPDGNQQKIDPNPPTAPSHKLSLSSQDISEVERPLFEKYWDELDPFGAGKVNLPYIVTFLGTCHLSDRHIQQIIVLFEHQHEWERHHVYALLRLVSHIKHGRDINGDLIYLPAPSVPLTTELSISCSYPSYTNYHQPRFRSFSDPSVFAVEESLESQSNDAPTHHQRRSVDDTATGKARKKAQPLPSSLLLMQAFIPPPAPSPNNNPFRTSPATLERHDTVHINLKSNRAHIPPPPVPSQKTKPPSLKHRKTAPTAVITNPKNIFDTPPNYHHCDQRPTIQQNRISHSHRDQKKHRPGR